MNLRGIVSQRLIRTVDSSRVAAVEILLDSPRVKDLIHQGEVNELKEAMVKGETLGMQTFDMHLLELYKAGKISLDEALRNADSANNLRLEIKLSEEDENDPSDVVSNGSAFGSSQSSSDDAPEKNDFNLTLES